MSERINSPLLIMFLGAPGSGKTYFATRLAPQISAVTLNADAMRLSVFDTLEAIEQLREREPNRVYRNIFRAMDYAAEQVLSAGHSVVYDSQQTKRRHRREMEKLALRAGAVPVLVWLKVGPEVAARRGQQRENSRDTHQYTAEKMSMLTKRFNEIFDKPADDERVIVIDGEASFDEQYISFRDQLSSLVQS